VARRQRVEADEEQVAPADGEVAEDPVALDGADEIDDSGANAAVALVVALLSFLLAVTFVILRHVLFHA
jgi:hypothetical protein